VTATSCNIETAAATLLDAMPAQCVVFDEFLAPGELNALMRGTLAREAEFQMSEVVSPGVTGGIVDYERRRSRVLLDTGKAGGLLVERIRQCLPLVLTRLGQAPFPITEVEAQITASNDGDFFGWHCDNTGNDRIAGREITFVYFFHCEPKQFRGGELRIYDTRWENGAYVPARNYRVIVPQQNQLVMFPSVLAHEITPVDCPSRAFADSRFTVNGWFHH
jgi:SM-20-related protein